MPRARPDALPYAMKLLEARERTRAGLERALTNKGYSEVEIEAALTRLGELKYLDDSRAARVMAAKDLEQGWSSDAVKHRLEGKGVTEAVAAQAIEGANAHDEARARALVSRRKLTGAKAARFLAGKGYDEDLIRRVVPLIAGSDDGG